MSARGSHATREVAVPFSERWRERRLRSRSIRLHSPGYTGVVRKRCCVVVISKNLLKRSCDTALRCAVTSYNFLNSKLWRMRAPYRGECRGQILRRTVGQKTRRCKGGHYASRQRRAWTTNQILTHRTNLSSRGESRCRSIMHREFGTSVQHGYYAFHHLRHLERFPQETYVNFMYFTSTFLNVGGSAPTPRPAHSGDRRRTLGGVKHARLCPRHFTAPTGFRRNAARRILTQHYPDRERVYTRWCSQPHQLTAAKHLGADSV